MGLAKNYWNTPNKIPDHVKTNPDFMPCTICSFKGKSVLCHAIYPLFPIIDQIKDLISIETVVVVYRDKDDKFHIKETNVQLALMYLSIMSLFEFCDAMKKYRKYFYNIIPVNSPKEISKQLYLNIYFMCEGNQKKMSKIMLDMATVTNITTTCQVKRLRLLDVNDGILNAFVNTDTIAALLTLRKDQALQKDINTYVDEAHNIIEEPFLENNNILKK